jgi:hypothetical protein
MSELVLFPGVSVIDYFASDLTVSGDWTFTTNPTFSGTAGSICFLGTTGTLMLDNANFFWDDTNNRLGIGTATPASTLDVSGSVGAAIVNTTASTLTLDDTHYTVLSNATGGSTTLTLPTASTVTGRIYHIKKSDPSANTVTVDGSGSETIDGGTTAVITTQYECITIQCDGSEWWIL